MWMPMEGFWWAFWVFWGQVLVNLPVEIFWAMEPCESGLAESQESYCEECLVLDVRVPEGDLT